MAKLYSSSPKHYVAKKATPNKLYSSGATGNDITGAEYLGGKVAAGAASIGNFNVITKSHARKTFGKAD